MKTITKTVSIAASALMLAYTLPFSIFADDKDTITKGSFAYMPAFADEPATETYYYSDSYFTGTSDVENPHLRTMSMALALSTMEVGDSSYVTDLLSDIGFKDISIGDMNDKPAKDTIGTAIGHKKVNGQELVAVAVRGSKYDSEWASNLTAGSEGDIHGFSEASEKVNNRIKEYIAENGLTDVKLWITGYSRAGSAADLTGVYINEHTAEFKTSADDLYVYTFEAPAASVSDKIYDNIHETRNKNDIINYVYPESWGIHSNGKTQWIGEDKIIVSKTAEVGMQGVVVRDAEAVTKEEFIMQFMDYLSGELTRDSFSGEFDGAVSSLIELYFNKTPEERQAFTVFYDSIKEKFSGESINEDEELKTLLGDDLFFGIFDHNSDKMYEKLTNDMKTVLTDMYNDEKSKGDAALSEEDFNAVLDTLYPLLRKLGPVIVKDMHCHIGMNSEDFLPDDYNDPNYAPGYYEEEEEEEESDENLTESEKGARDGRSAAWTGYSDGSNGREKYTNYNDVPDDDEEYTEEYLEAYKQAYKEEYEIQYADGVKDNKTDYQKGESEGDYRGVHDASQDIENEYEYGTSFNDEPEVYEDSDPYSEEFIQGYKAGYKNAYDTKFKERPLYHVATFALNFNELWAEHQPQNNWELVKSLDSYYSEEAPKSTTTSTAQTTTQTISSSTTTTSSASSKTSSPATGAAVPPVIALLTAVGVAFVSKKKK